MALIARERISKEARIQQIKAASKKVFLKKGFRNTVMKDGDAFRYKKIEESLTQSTSPTIKTVVHIIMDKMLVENEYTRLFVMFLCQLEEDPDLKELYEDIKAKSIASLRTLLSDFGYVIVKDEVFEFVINIINTTLLGCELLGIRPNLTANRDHIYLMLELYLENITKQAKA